MIKRKNVLAENMLRFGPKNLTKSQVAALRRLIEQMEKMTVTNVDLIGALKGKKVAPIMDLDNNLIAFPRSGTPTVGDPVILNRQGAIYQTGTGTTTSSYILLGNIGKLTGKEGNWGIEDNSALKVFTYQKSDAAATNRAGNPIVPEKPYGNPTIVTDPALIISTLTKHKYGNQSNFSLMKSFSQKYIADLVKLFQTMNQLTDVAINSDSIMKYTKEKLS